MRVVVQHEVMSARGVESDVFYCEGVRGHSCAGGRGVVCGPPLDRPEPDRRRPRRLLGPLRVVSRQRAESGPTRSEAAALRRTLLRMGDEWGA